MEIEIIEISHLSGDKCHIYSVIIDGDEDDLFTTFIKDNLSTHRDETMNIFNRLRVIGNKTGAIPTFFKDREGAPVDGIQAFYDIPNSNLRLYCINYGSQTILLGSGGPKPKTIRAYQEDEQLSNSVKQLQRIEKIIKQAVRDRDIILHENGEISGITKLTDYEDD